MPDRSATPGVAENTRNCTRTGWPVAPVRNVIGSNLEEASAGQSRADFIAKARISLKEARETHYWLRLIEATEMIAPSRIRPLVQEANEIVAILTTIVKKATPK